ncbi:hypothetical protein GW17_00019167 [Ensete ventricosum]|nr:hypothetical protein GW17_00019167 [Ensete ventricosum]
MASSSVTELRLERLKREDTVAERSGSGEVANVELSRRRQISHLVDSAVGHRPTIGGEPPLGSPRILATRPCRAVGARSGTFDAEVRVLVDLVQGVRDSRVLMRRRMPRAASCPGWCDGFQGCTFGGLVDLCYARSASDRAAGRMAVCLAELLLSIGLVELLILGMVVYLAELLFLANLAVGRVVGLGISGCLAKLLVSGKSGWLAELLVLVNLVA